MIDEDKLNALELFGENEYLHKEIERLQKEIKEYQEELVKADSITQSCIFEGKAEATMSFRECLNHLERLHSIIKEVREYITQPDNIQSVAFCKEDGEIMNLYKIDGYKSLELLGILDKVGDIK